jgi:hypothetical protein
MPDGYRQTEDIKKWKINRDRKEWTKARCLQTDRRNDIKEKEDKQRQKEMEECQMVTDRQKERYKRKGR